MKLIHLADLHIGKRVNEFSMLDDQRYILTEILNIIDDEKPDCVLIAGDVYDKSVPSAEAVEVFDKFVNDLAKRRVEAFIIAGNHDSAERMSFASRLIDISGIHIAGAYKGSVQPRELCDEFGKVNIYMLPFIKPINVRQAFGIEHSISYSEAVSIAIENMGVNTNERNVILSHQFVVGASTCDSEELSVGGTDGVSASVYDSFDYAALGHLHRPQQAMREAVRYSGTPLKYSFSEVNDKKSVTVVELLEKGNVKIKAVPLKPRREMVEIRGLFDEIISPDFYSGLNTEDYYHITLLDENDVPDAIFKLRTIYKNTMRLDYDNKRTRAAYQITEAQEVEKKQPLELVEELYTKQNGADMSEEQRAYLQELIEKIWEGEE